MAKLAAADETKRAASGAKNALESYILSFRSALEDDKDLVSVTTEKERLKFGAQLEKMEDWLYDEGEHLAAPEFRCGCTLSSLICSVA